MAESVADLAEKADRGEPFDRADAARLLDEPDLISIGLMGEAARRRGSGDVITFGRVDVRTRTGAAVEAADGAAGQPSPAGADAGEVRLLGVPSSADEACRWVREIGAPAAGTPMSAFSLADLFAGVCRQDTAALIDLAGALAAAGVESVADVPLDRFASTEQAAAAIDAVRRGGLQAWRWTFDEAPADRRLDLILRARDLQAATGAARAFAPLPQRDPVEEPSTGYDDVRTVAVARLVCPGIPSIQVDWPLYGPKLAQVAITFGANDVDGIAPAGVPELGPRRAPVADITRQIQAASGVPAERNGRYERRA